MGPVVVFDGACNLCNASVDFLLRRDRRGVFRFASNQSEAGRRLLSARGIDPEDVSTVYLLDGDRVAARSTAALRIARRLGFPWNLASVFLAVPRPVRDAAYNIIARNRYRWFGKRDSCRMATPAERARFLESAEDVAS